MVSVFGRMRYAPTALLRCESHNKIVLLHCFYEYPQISNVGAGFARPDTSTDISMGALGQANPAPTSKLAKCGHSFVFFNLYVK